VLRHYRRPIWKDRLFWLVGTMSALTTAAFVAVILVITGVPETPLGWARPLLLGAVVLLLSFRLLGAGVTTSRHFQRGLGEGSAPRPNDLEAKGRAAGAVVGRAVKAARSPKPATTSSPAATPTPTPTTRPAAVPTMNAPPPQAAAEPVPTPVTSVPAPIEPLPAAPEPEPTGTGSEHRTVTAEPESHADPEPAAEPVPAAGLEAPPPEAEATPKVTADAAARSLGSMVGRRLAERRKKG
jgi:hypothetical protein